MAPRVGEPLAMNEYEISLQNIERLTRIEEKLNGISAHAGMTQTQADSIHRDQESRIRSLERFRWSLPVTALTSIISALSALTAAYFAAKGG